MYLYIMQKQQTNEIMKNQTITTGTKVGYEKPANEFKVGIVKDIKNGKALVNSRWCNLSNLHIITKS